MVGASVRVASNRHECSIEVRGTLRELLQPKDALQDAPLTVQYVVLGLYYAPVLTLSLHKQRSFCWKGVLFLG